VRYILLLVLALSALVGCAKEPPAQANLRNHRNVAAGYALNLPQGWTVIASTDSDEMFTFSPPDAAGVKLVVSVHVEKKPKVDTLQEYLKLSREQLSGKPGYDEQRAEVTRHPSGQDACLIDAYTLATTPGSTAAGAAGEAKRRFKQYGFLQSGKQVVISALMPATDSDRWLREVDPILGSFLVW
jgi:hypothetical protein